MCALSADTTVLTIKAVSKNNQHLTYAPLFTWQDASEFFHIDPETGAIKTGGKQIDYEKLSIFRMQFKAYESQTLFSTCLVVIRVTDVNDNSPVFGTEFYEGRVLENSPPNTGVLRVHAYDPDTGTGGKLTYSIADRDNSDGKYFSIDSTTGVITTKETFDRELASQKHFTVIIGATDGGNKLGRSYADIEVVDDNDVGPVFAPTQYSLSVKEDAPLGEIVHVFTAKDIDVGLNSLVKFYISSSGERGHAFHMKTISYPQNVGQLIVDGKLDYETNKVYNLQVISTDGRATSQPPASVTIEVIAD